MDNKESNYGRIEGSANQAVNRVRKDPDISGRSNGSKQEPRRLAKPSAKPKRPSGENDTKRVPRVDGPRKENAQRPNEQVKKAPKKRPQGKPEGRHYIPMEESDNFKSDLRINKKMRRWNKYKNFIIGGIVLIAVVFAVAKLVGSCAKDVKEEQESMFSKPSMGALQVTEGASNASEAATVPTTQAAQGKVITTTKTVAQEDYTSESSFENSVFLGDALVYGMEYYKFLSASNVVADNNLTLTKAEDKISSVASKNPEKIYIMLGINDLNYNTKTVDGIFSDYQTLVAGIKSALPNTKVYIVSVTPVTKSCEAKTNMYITMSNVEALNTKLKSYVETADGTYFVDICSTLLDSSGYMKEDVTSNGYNLKSGYYGFLLNTIAEMTK